MPSSTRHLQTRRPATTLETSTQDLPAAVSPLCAFLQRAVTRHVLAVWKIEGDHHARQEEKEVERNRLPERSPALLA